MTNSPPLRDPKEDSPPTKYIWGGFDDSWTYETSSLLHNSGPIFRTQVVHQVRRERCGGPGLLVQGERLPAPTSLRSVLALFTADNVPDSDLEGRLRQEILAYAAICGLPAVALVTRQGIKADTVCTDPRTVACLLTQASSRVYLRDKEPNLSYLKRDRNFILVYPRECST